MERELKLQKEARKRLLTAYLLEVQRILQEAPMPPASGGSAVPPSPVAPAPATNTAASMPPPPPVPGAVQPGQDGQPKPFDVDAMIERMNIIRGGRSFADPEVYGQLTSFFKGMSEADKAVVDKFLQDINRIVIQVDTTQQVGGGNMAQPPVGQPSAAPAPAPAAPAAGVPGM